MLAKRFYGILEYFFLRIFEKKTLNWFLVKLVTMFDHKKIVWNLVAWLSLIKNEKYYLWFNNFFYDFLT